MKKFLTSVFCVITLLGSLLVLGSCDDATKTIAARCPIDHTVFKMPFKPTRATTFGDGTDFEVKLSLAEIGEIVNKMESMKATAYDEYVFIEQTTADGYTHYYLLVLISALKNGAYYYNFQSPTLYGDNGQKDSVIYPQHLYDMLWDARNSGKVILEKRSTVAYKINATIEEFAQFYLKTNMFEVTREENQLTVLLKPIPVRDAGGMFGDSYHSKKPFVIEFETKDDGLYATYQLSYI